MCCSQPIQGQSQTGIEVKQRKSCCNCLTVAKAELAIGIATIAFAAILYASLYVKEKYLFEGFFSEVCKAHAFLASKFRISLLDVNTLFLVLGLTETILGGILIVILPSKSTQKNVVEATLPPLPSSPVTDKEKRVDVDSNSSEAKKV